MIFIPYYQRKQILSSPQWVHTQTLSDFNRCHLVVTIVHMMTTKEQSLPPYSVEYLSWTSHFWSTKDMIFWGIRVMVSNTTFNNISVISWRSVYWWRKLEYTEKTTMIFWKLMKDLNMVCVKLTNCLQQGYI